MTLMSKIYDAFVNYFLNDNNLKKFSYLYFGMDMSAIEQTRVGGVYSSRKVEMRNKRIK